MLVMHAEMMEFYALIRDRQQTWASISLSAPEEVLGVVTMYAVFQKAMICLLVVFLTVGNEIQMRDE